MSLPEPASPGGTGAAGGALTTQLRAFGAGFRHQLRAMRAYPDSLIPFLTAPLFAVIFLAIINDAGREDLAGYAVVAPVFIALWWLALFQAGWVVEFDRWEGTIELLVASPANFAVVVLGRIVGIVIMGLIAVAEVWVIARVVFREDIELHHPAAFVATVVATLIAMAGTAVVMAGLFVLTRSAATFSNSASYPFYVLGGILVPVSFLPDWLEPLSSVIFLSWSADLLRDSLQPGAIDDVPQRLGAVLLLGSVGFVAGAFLIEYILRRVQNTGELSHT